MPIHYDIDVSYCTCARIHIHIDVLVLLVRSRFHQTPRQTPDGECPAHASSLFGPRGRARVDGRHGTTPRGSPSTLCGGASTYILRDGAVLRPRPPRSIPANAIPAPPDACFALVERAAVLRRCASQEPSHPVDRGRALVDCTPWHATNTRGSPPPVASTSILRASRRCNTPARRPRPPRWITARPAGVNTGILTSSHALSSSSSEGGNTPPRPARSLRKPPPIAPWPVPINQFCAIAYYSMHNCPTSVDPGPTVASLNPPPTHPAQRSARAGPPQIARDDIDGDLRLLASSSSGAARITFNYSDGSVGSLLARRDGGEEGAALRPWSAPATGSSVARASWSLVCHKRCRMLPWAVGARSAWWEATDTSRPVPNHHMHQEGRSSVCSSRNITSRRSEQGTEPIASYCTRTPRTEHRKTPGIELQRLHLGSAGRDVTVTVTRGRDELGGPALVRPASTGIASRILPEEFELSTTGDGSWASDDRCAPRRHSVGGRRSGHAPACG
ncbi:hypothetical protein FA95DRAFT_884515 [Auriscalpium vulgare]|uniref:Uncharacterized protein n=1 Tax=Auriscalpium vulgare TaxID=40419 RepID=A0ACB8R8D3_9AGAM|nr:hypothetical protein FA95DRAFT_884515 [Auriscalpium vulgare]